MNESRLWIRKVSEYFDRRVKMLNRRPEGRSRETMAKYGPEGLSGFELLQAIIGSGGSWGDVLKIAHDVKKLVAQKAVN